MASDATNIMNFITTGLAAIRAIPVQTVKRPVANAKPPNGGWNSAWPSNSWALSELDAEGIDANGDFEETAVAYSFLIEYAKPSAAMTAAAASPQYADDDDVKDVRQALRRAFYLPRIAGFDVADVTWKPRQTYEFSGTGGAIVLISGQTVVFEIMEPRPT